MKKIVLTSILLTFYCAVIAQTELEKVKSTINDYMEGTANGMPEIVTNAFHKDLKLYHVKNGELQVWEGKNYIKNIKKGKKSNRIGKIISVDIENNAAMAKLEIKMPDYKRVYTDYLLLLKVKNEWKIIHKSFTYRKL
ncbi:Nuclear transport factor 2 family protein [Tenacibaculum sp. 190524A02b]|uniref:nuclear transport factor 2 family protein n=1 Tax=Tenacibaculum vairaonense TaxID=3137860 RepID=UPI0032B17EF1